MVVEIIKEKLKKLIELDKKFSIFGSNSHKYVFNSKLTEEELQKFEEKNKIVLPEEYREYLKSIGNGGAGPFYGLLELEDNDNNSIDLSREFPYTYEEPLNLFEVYESMNEIDDDNEEEQDRFLNEIYGKSLRGIKFLAHEGCGMYSVLVVKGKEYGNIWYFDFANDAGVYPLTSEKTGKSMKFFEWMELWIDKSLAHVEKRNKELEGYAFFIKDTYKDN
ncbi:SMI1/KNR4 family protein [Fusobacterium sp.]|uniref:SMI1/KNR4 family protein n=1 Tax=Fusobacterium sp. TaxID=68766 RepID=UPI0028FDD20C|nr:SMI1/KNR4 family protein [Fusobacterium sp.]MDU1909755.1 SMI1/KNR4 family protein [Fusobacterium sp.]